MSAELAPEEPAPISRAGWLERMPRRVWVALASLAACLLTVYFFFPRFAGWRGIDLAIPELWMWPEVNRAVAVLEQLAEPFKRIDHPSNRVVNWRLLFPLLGHYAHLPRGLFLALPHVGCWAAAALLVHVLLRELRARRLAFYGTVIACASAWFFVSTAWLTYNDSWVMLGLLAVAFVRSRIALAAACVFVPWIDERFVLAVPVMLVLRTYVFPERERWLATLGRDGAAALAALAPYLVVRIVAYSRGTDWVASAHVAEMLGEEVPRWRYVEGVWAGLRCNWFYVVAWGCLAWSAGPRWWSALAIAGTAAAMVVMVNVASDIHRSAAVFLPVAVAGMVLMQRRRPALNARLMPVLTLLSLALPASHVITAFDIPIQGFFDEWHAWRNRTNPELDPRFYEDQGKLLVQAGRIDQAAVHFDRALRVDPEFVEARLDKATMYVGSRRFDEALVELDLALATRPDWVDALVTRSRAREATGDVAGAIADAERALAVAPPGWRARSEVEQHLERLRSRGSRQR